jgi:DNA polymerase-3 subunit epsilon/ATP-dependent DNA helicase DinG
MLDQIQALDLRELSEISRLTQRINWPLRDLFEEALRLKAKNVFVDAAAGALKTTDEAARPPAEIIPLKPTGDARPLGEPDVAAFFAPDGPMGRAFEGYEQRPPQVQMASAVARAFNSGDVSLIEAGTGTGKSLSYLVPAALFAAQRGERVVVSTNTINLQDQLFFKDIPDLQRLLVGQPADHEGAAPAAPPFTAALLKGRGNYLCLKRYNDLRRSESLSPEEVRTLLKVQLWLPTTESGDKAELLLMEREGAAWGRVNVTAETCIGPRCPHFRECYFFQARRKAEAAHVVVVNHALMLADLASQSNVLPPYDHLVIDEAHNLEDVATDQLSFAVDQAALLKFFDDLFQEGGAQVVSGLLSELPSYLRESAAEQSDREKIEQITQRSTAPAASPTTASTCSPALSPARSSRTSTTPGCASRPACATSPSGR